MAGRGRQIDEVVYNKDKSAQYNLTSWETNESFTRKGAVSVFPLYNNKLDLGEDIVNTNNF